MEAGMKWVAGHQYMHDTHWTEAFYDKALLTISKAILLHYLLSMLYNIGALNLQ